MSNEVIVEVVDGTQVITINRPEVRNAINLATARALASALEELDERKEVTVGILTGAGSTFCAGMDLKAFLAGERPTIPGKGFAGLVESPPKKPLIAAVEGAAVAGGFEIVLSCDLIVAAENAIFGLPEVKRGLVAAGGGLLRLPSRIPYHLAMEWSLTGANVMAQVAKDAQLVNLLTTPGESLAGAFKLARAICANGPLAVQATKEIITNSRDWPLSQAFERQSVITEPVRASKDAREGALAFTERRSPVWLGE